MSKYIITIPEVWGNEKDGWEVNDARSSGSYVDLTYDEACCDQTIIDRLIEAELLAAGTLAENDVVVEGDVDMLYLSEYESGKPLYHLLMSFT